MANKPAQYAYGQRIAPGWIVLDQVPGRTDRGRCLFNVQCNCGFTKVADTSVIYKYSYTESEGCQACVKALQKERGYFHYRQNIVPPVANRAPVGNLRTVNNWKVEPLGLAFITGSLPTVTR